MKVSVEKGRRPLSGGFVLCIGEPLGLEGLGPLADFQGVGGALISRGDVFSALAFLAQCPSTDQPAAVFIDLDVLTLGDFDSIPVILELFPRTSIFVQSKRQSRVQLARSLGALEHETRSDGPSFRGAKVLPGGFEAASRAGDSETGEESGHDRPRKGANSRNETEEPPTHSFAAKVQLGVVAPTATAGPDEPREESVSGPHRKVGSEWAAIDAMEDYSMHVPWRPDPTRPRRTPPRREKLHEIPAVGKDPTSASSAPLWLLTPREWREILAQSASG